MENSELQKIWKDLDLTTNQKSKEELNLLLASKTKQTINKYLIITAISVTTSVVLLVYLLITSLNRQNDLMYLINNATLGFITLISLFSGLISWYKLQNNKLNQPLRSWLEVRISLLSKWLNGRFSKLYLILIPVLYILIVLSIHVYFENKPFMDVLKSEESVIGLTVGAIIGLFVSYLVIAKIRKFQINNLRFLKDLYTRLSSLG